MNSTTNVATTNCGGVFGISHGMHTPGRLSTDKTTTIKNWSSKILPKLKYRGNLREFEEWEKMVKSAAHALDIPMEPVPPTKAALKLHEHYAKLDDTAPELEKAYIDACNLFNGQCTALFDLIVDAIDFSGPFMTHDLEWLDSEHLRDYKNRFSWGDRLWKDVKEKAAAREPSSFAAERNVFYNDVKWDAVSGSQCTRIGLIKAVSDKFSAWIRLPEMSEATADVFLNQLVEHFPRGPWNAVLVPTCAKIREHINDNLLCHRSTGGNSSSSARSAWIREFLDAVYKIAKAYDMPYGTSEQLLPALAPAPAAAPAIAPGAAPSEKPSPYGVDTNNCKECQTHICIGKGMMNGAGKAFCICFNDKIPFPPNSSKSNINIVKTYRALIKLEPSKTDIKTTSPKEAWSAVRAHKAKLGDKSGRFQGPLNGTRQQSNPFQSSPEDYEARIAAAVAAWSNGAAGTDEMLTPMMAGAIRDDDPDGVIAEWESSVDAESMERHFSDDSGNDSALAFAQQMEVKVKAMAEAMEAQAEELASLRFRAAPPTRADAFDTPAAVTEPRYTTIPSATIPPFDPMRQLADTPARVIPDRSDELARDSDAKVRKASAITGVTYVGKALAAFENEKLVLAARAESPVNAFKVICAQVWKFLSSGTGGRSLSALACLLAYRMRGPLRSLIKRKWSTFSSTAVLLVQWAAATTLLSARLAFSDTATRFFQAGFEYFGGHVATLTSAPAITLPDGSSLADASPIIQEEEEPRMQSVIVPRSVIVPHVPDTLHAPLVPNAADDVKAIGLPSADQAIAATEKAYVGKALMLAKYDEAISAALAQLSVTDMSAMLEVDRLMASKERMMLHVGSPVALALPSRPAPTQSAVAPPLFGDTPPPVRRSFTPSLSPVVDSEVDGPRSDCQTTVNDKPIVDISPLRDGFASLPSSDAGGQLVSDAPAAVSPSAPPLPATAPVPSESPPSTVDKPATGTGETVLVMGDNTTTQSLEAVVARMELEGGAVALADNGATVNCLVVPVGRIPGTRLGDVIPVSIGDASEIRINSTDIYCVELGGTEGSASYDYMFRGGLYPNPDRAIGNVISETILHSLLEMHSTPGMGRYYSLPGAEPLLPILAPNKCSYLTIKPLGGARAAALHAKAVREGLDTRSIHFGVITPAPIDATKEAMFANIAARPIAGKLVAEPEAYDLFSGPYEPHRDPTFCMLLESMGIIKATPVDNDKLVGGGVAGDMLTQSTYVTIQAKADAGIIGYVHIAPMCSLTNVGRILDRNAGKEDISSPVMREAGHINGGQHLSPKHKEVIRKDNMVNMRAAAIAMSVGRNGGIVSLETPSHRDDASRPDVYQEGATGHITVAHLPVYASMITLLDMRQVTTEFCAYTDDSKRNLFQKSTDFLCLPSWN